MLDSRPKPALLDSLRRCWFAWRELRDQTIGAGGQPSVHSTQTPR